jgi:cobalt-zinc-cadmium efflux system outer membrane protein
MVWRQAVVVSVTICGVAGLASAQAPPSALGVADLVVMAMQRNREFLAVEQRLAETQALLRQAGARPAPALEVEQATGRPLGSGGERAFSVGYFHTIETSGKRDKRIAVAEKSNESVAAELADRLRLMTLDVKVRYAQAVRERQKLETIQQLLSTNREYYSLTSTRVQHGDAAPLEGQLVLTDLNRVELQQIVLANSADRATLELRKVVGVPAAEPLPLLTSLPPATTGSSLSDLVLQALRDRPDLRALRLLEEQALAEETLAGAEGAPNLTASVRYLLTDSAFDQFGYDSSGRLAQVKSHDNLLAFGLSVPLFAPKRNQAAMEAAQSRSAAARLRREHLESIIRLEVEAAFHRWQSAMNAVDMLNRGVIGQSERNLVVLRQAYSLGQLRVLDVLNEQRKLIETQLTYLDVQSELFQAFSELEASVGGSIQ